MPRLATIAIVFALFGAIPIHAQDDQVSLGDVARAVRQSRPAEDQVPVIDNDNLNLVMDRGEAERLNGKPVFSIDPSGKTFRMISPDGICSLSFDAKASALLLSPYAASELPADALAKLESAAAIHDGVLEITVLNGSGWELKEIAIGLTLLNPPAGLLQPTRFMPDSDLQVEAKPPELTTLYHLRATSMAGSTTVFRTVLSDDLAQASDWHWALLSARGVAPTPVLPATLAAVPAIQSPALAGSATGGQASAINTNALPSPGGTASAPASRQDQAIQLPTSTLPPQP
jgi:hypothetical protein